MPDWFKNIIIFIIINRIIRDGAINELHREGHQGDSHSEIVIRDDCGEGEEEEKEEE